MKKNKSNDSYDSNPSDNIREPRRRDENFIQKSNRPRSGLSNTSPNGTLKSARFSTSSALNRLTEPPEAKSPYGLITHKVRQIVPQEIACKLGCKGAKCKYDSSNWPKEQMALDGIFSTWYCILTIL